MSRDRNGYDGYGSPGVSGSRRNGSGRGNYAGRGTAAGGRGSSTGRAAAGGRGGSTGRGTAAGGRGSSTGRGTAAGGRRSSVGHSSAAGGRPNAGGRSNGANARRRRKKSRVKFFLCFLLVLILAVSCVVGGGFLYHRIKEKTAVPDIQVDLESLDSPYAVVIDSVSGTVIGSKRGDEVIYPASMTKIMTVLVAIEQIEDLNETIQMSYDYYDALYAADASRAGFEPGEDAVIRDLLYGAMLPSGAECCMELSVQAAGSEAAFAELMNQKVQELGLTQTHFMNSTGLHDENQYTTPHEMAKILQEALRNKTFREVFTTHSYTVQPTAVHPDGFTFQSSMFKNMESALVINGEIRGGKTGFTEAAGHCLASMAEIGGREYIQVTAGWAENPRTNSYHINDAYLGYNMVGRALSEN